jgi:hypothetical protein
MFEKNGATGVSRVVVGDNGALDHAVVPTPFIKLTIRANTD